MWCIRSQTNGFGDSGKGGAQRNVYACSDHKEQVMDELKAEIAKLSEMCGGTNLGPVVALLLSA